MKPGRLTMNIRQSQDRLWVVYTTLMCAITIILAMATAPSAAAAAGTCAVVEAPVAEAEPPGEPVGYCDRGSDHGDRCDDAGDCTDGVCSPAVSTHNRYLAFQAPASWSSQQVALRVTLVNIDGFPAFNGDTRWIGAPQSYPDEDRTDPERSFMAAPTSCAPVYRAWSTNE